ncbi:MAG: YgjP-like metallopeptidase domain-containing protein [Lawsonibacter sp.]|nr:YgjP-like metallopeptidase domain-containing protein [Lawsonibacter sp.]
MEQLRMIDTPAGTIQYVLIKKRVKNLNLRVGAAGRVTLSVPYGCSDGRADQMVREKCGWISSTMERQRAQTRELLPEPSRANCRILLQEALERVYPLTAALGVPMPEMKIRTMKSQWGNCHWKQGYITLNTALARCPEHLRDYVALHELVHFLHHDHGPGFYGRMDALMPDWREWRKELRSYAAALKKTGTG